MVPTMLPVSASMGGGRQPFHTAFGDPWSLLWELNEGSRRPQTLVPL
jgi:hypothetical protein